MRTLKIFIALLVFSLLYTVTDAYSCLPTFDKTTDTGSELFYAFFDLRDRESFIQITNINQSEEKTIHVQIFDVNNDCVENDFFDTLTGLDTHVYDMRNILTNNGAPSGVELPDNSYGMVAIINVNPEGTMQVPTNDLIGNFRILDANGYEYRTNMQGQEQGFFAENVLTFNFNTEAGVTLSDVVGITASLSFPDPEVQAADVPNINIVMDIDILNLDEVVFSCRDIAFACVDQDNPRLEELLENRGVSVASFEYGINEAIPHSKGAELLCPGNNISNGIVRLIPETFTSSFSGYIGLNNGNGRGSMDSFWLASLFGNQGGG
jgi:hypothetical protein